jgi:hypothetical protein
LPLRDQTKRAKNSRFGPILGAWVVEDSLFQMAHLPVPHDLLQSNLLLSACKVSGRFGHHESEHLLTAYVNRLFCSVMARWSGGSVRRSPDPSLRTPSDQEPSLQGAKLFDLFTFRFLTQLLQWCYDRRATLVKSSTILAEIERDV